MLDYLLDRVASMLLGAAIGAVVTAVLWGTDFVTVTPASMLRMGLLYVLLYLSVVIMRHLRSRRARR